MESAEEKNVSDTENRIIEFYEMIAARIGDDITPERIEEFVKNANDKRLMFHGVRTDLLVNNIISEGVKNNSVMNQSFWSTGYRIFGDPSARSDGRSTTFFDYSHSTKNSISSDTYTMNMVVAEGDGISGFEVPENGYFSVGFVVPKELIHVLRVEVYDSAGISKGREAGQKAEQEMFGLLEKFVSEESKETLIVREVK